MLQQGGGGQMKNDDLPMLHECAVEILKKWRGSMINWLLRDIGDFLVTGGVQTDSSKACILLHGGTV